MSEWNGKKENKFKTLEYRAAPNLIHMCLCVCVCRRKNQTIWSVFVCFMYDVHNTHWSLSYWTLLVQALTYTPQNIFNWLHEHTLQYNFLFVKFWLLFSTYDIEQMYMYGRVGVSHSLSVTRIYINLLRLTVYVYWIFCCRINLFLLSSYISC